MRSIYRHRKLKIDVNSSITSDDFSDTDYHSDASSLSLVEAKTIATTKASWGENIFGESDSDISNCITDSSIDLDSSSCISSLFSELNENDKELAFASLDQFLLSESDSESSNNLSSLESIDSNNQYHTDDRGYEYDDRFDFDVIDESNDSFYLNLLFLL